MALFTAVSTGVGRSWWEHHHLYKSQIVPQHAEHHELVPEVFSGQGAIFSHVEPVDYGPGICLDRC
ncbi:MAG: hypothetical protein CM1200mP22_07350 [Dehalococcoidia bacterium]|nr:MAG: hypothetical protein CM1200mP22_07350 [Dehalococcoidia bacterium]